MAEHHALIHDARQLGLASINVDLIYGLPRQTNLARTVREVVTLRPARIALYGYAHLPSIQRHQCRIDESTLPDPSLRLALFDQATTAFVAAGYESIGMDHFALPEDELAEAARSGRLGRNFMGYTVQAAPDVIGCGLSAIGDVAGAYVQNHKRLSDY